MKLAISSAPKARKVFASTHESVQRAIPGLQAAHLPCAKWSFWWVSFREQTRVTSRERRSSSKIHPRFSRTYFNNDGFETVSSKRSTPEPQLALCS
jgi:hypothetical protein